MRTTLQTLRTSRLLVCDPCASTFFRMTGNVNNTSHTTCLTRLQLVVDHFGFFLQDGVADEAAWEQLLSLAK